MQFFLNILDKIEAKYRPSCSITFFMDGSCWVDYYQEGELKREHFSGLGELQEELDKPSKDKTN